MQWLVSKRLDLMMRTVARFNHLARRFPVGESVPAHLETGIAGETSAFFYLRRKGYTVVARRWSSGVDRGDLDLVAWQGELLCIIEVKTRTAHDIAAAEVSVDSAKRRTLRRLTRAYVRHLPQEAPPPVRFDVLSVYLVPGQAAEFMHFEAAFGWSEHDEYERR